MKISPIEPRFWSKVEKTSSPDSCWNWKASCYRNGYGQFSIGKKKKMAHRIAYELVRGLIPAGKVIDHLCRNVRCVNPDHLEVVDERTNLLRGTGVSAKNAVKTHCPMRHPLFGLNLYVNPDGQRCCRICRRAAFKRFKKANP